MAVDKSGYIPIPALGRAAKGALVWGAGFTLLRDIMQFGTMLVLVRILSPDDYGRAALSQAVLGLLSVMSANTFSAHVLQHRDPAIIDWQAQFTASMVLNTFLFFCTLIVAGVLSLVGQYAGAASPLAILSLTFLVEIPAGLRIRMTEVTHNWARFRALTALGTFLALIVGLVIGCGGGGVWALIVQVPLFGIPAAIDLVLIAKWRPDWSWSWARYRKTMRFGLTRVGSGALIRGRQTVEQAVLVGAYDFPTLGIFTRSLGLAALITGRIGTVTLASLYPVITRTDQRSERFRRIAGLVLRGVAWATIPAGIFLAINAPDMISLLYGPKWTNVSNLLPLAAAYSMLTGIGSSAYSLLLANDGQRTCLLVDAVTAGVGTVLAFCLIPLGPHLYLLSLVMLAAFVLAVTLFVLCSTGGISILSLVDAFVPPLVAAGVASAAVLAFRGGFLSLEFIVVRLGLECALFGTIFLLVIRFVFPRLLRDVLQVAPGGHWLWRALVLGQLDL